MTNGLYLLQYRKCDDETCCVLTSGHLPPPVPAPIMGTDGDHYLKFDDLYGKVQTTEKDCPSLKQKGNHQKQPLGIKHIASRVATTMKCCQCGKEQCIYSGNGKLTPKDQVYLEDIMFSCGMPFPGSNVYAASHLTCQSPNEKALKRTTTSTTDQDASTPSSSSSTTSAPTVSSESVPSSSSSGKRQATIDFAVSRKKKKNDNVCSVCKNEDPPLGRKKKIHWIDCNVCADWAHKVCAKAEGWRNIRNNNWLCLACEQV